MTISSQLLNLARDVNDLLTAYITLHDDVFKISWRKVIPIPFIFKAIDFRAIESETKQILTELKNRRSNLSNLRLTKPVDSAQNNLVGKFSETLNEYIEYLIQTLQLFIQVVHSLYLKSQNSQDYNYTQYKLDLDAYNAAITNYRAKGEELTQQFYELSSA